VGKGFERSKRGVSNARLEKPNKKGGGDETSAERVRKNVRKKVKKGPPAEKPREKEKN